MLVTNEIIAKMKHMVTMATMFVFFCVIFNVLMFVFSRMRHEMSYIVLQNHAKLLKFRLSGKFDFTIRFQASAHMTDRPQDACATFLTPSASSFRRKALPNDKKDLYLQSGSSVETDFRPQKDFRMVR